MPNRILKESICTSDNLDSLSIEAETFFYRLLVQCDDYGRMDARPAILLSRCYPLRLDRITTAMIAQWLDQLRHAELIVLYTVGGKPYLQFTTWDKHQQVRAQRSKYPAIADGLIADDSNGNQLLSNVPVIQSNPIQSESKSESESDNSADKPRKAVKPKTERASDELFDAIAKVTCTDPATAGASIGKVKSALVKANPPYTASEVLKFGADWPAWKDKPPTLWQLKEQIGIVRNGNGNGHHDDSAESIKGYTVYR